MKKLTEQEFDNLVKSKLYDFEKEPPASVFHALKTRMNPTLQAVPSKSWIWISAGVMGIVALTLIFYPFNKPVKSNAMAILTHNSIAPQPKTSDNSQIVPVQTQHNNVNTQNQKTTLPIRTQKVENISVSEPQKTNINQTSVISNQEPPVVQKQAAVVNPNNYQINVKAATCHKSNGKVVIKTDNHSIQFSWIDLSVDNSVVDNLKSGIYTVLAHIKNTVLDTLSIVVPDSGKVKVDFNMYELNIGNEVFSYFENSSVIDHVRWNKMNDVTYKWSFGDGTYSTLPEAQHSYTASGKFPVTLIITTPYGCTDSLTKSMVITIPDNFEKIPNVFSPNGDGKDDTFSPVLYDMQSVECTIYDRSGQLVYQWKTLNGSWDGKIRNSNQPAPEGTYYYVLQGVTKSGQNIFHKGMVQLER